MIRTSITPQAGKINLMLQIPENYIGKELEIIKFTKDEGMEVFLTANKKVSFTVLHSDIKNYKFNRNESNER